MARLLGLQPAKRTPLTAPDVSGECTHFNRMGAGGVNPSRWGANVVRPQLFNPRRVKKER